MGKSGSSSQTPSPRFLSDFFIINFSNHTPSTLFTILSGLFTLGFSNYNNSISSSINNLTQTVINVYQKVIINLPLTPTKCHYVFNFSDLDNVLKGIFYVLPHKLQDSASLCNLWIHECLRVFSDSLINQGDKNIVMNIIKNNLK